MNSMDERDRGMLEDFPKGTIVRAKDPDAYIASVASKIRDRLGEVTGHQVPTPNPIVTFPAVGRRKDFRKVFAFQPHRDLEIVTDAEIIAAWRDEVQRRKESAPPKLLALKKSYR